MVMIKGQHEGLDEALFFIDICLCKDSDKLYSNVATNQPYSILFTK